jgi:hypothetical protein
MITCHEADAFPISGMVPRTKQSFLWGVIDHFAHCLFLPRPFMFTNVKDLACVRGDHIDIRVFMNHGCSKIDFNMISSHVYIIQD